MVFHKIPGEAAWTLINQGRVVTPNQTTDTKEYKRIGDKNSKKVPGTVGTEVTLNLYVEDDIGELARGYVAITPLQLDLTAYDVLEHLRTWEWEG